MIVGWTNPLTNRVVPLDDPGMEFIMPREVLREFVRKEEEDERHQKDALTVTGPLGCPKQLGITRMLPYTPDPQKKWGMMQGTILHRAFAEIMRRDERWYNEEDHPDKCEFKGVVEGVGMGCLLDLVKKDYTKIWDWKTTTSGGDKWVHLGPKDTHTIQLNIGRELVQQQTGRDMSGTEMAAWVVGGTWQKSVIPSTPVGACLNMQVGKTKYSSGRLYTYRELLDHVKMMFDEWRNAAEAYEGKLEEVPLGVRQEIVRKLPLFGEGMWRNRQGGNMCLNYCAVYKDCKKLGGGL